jgi:lipopolysaccharide transport system permease protein
VCNGTLIMAFSWKGNLNWLQVQCYRELLHVLVGRNLKVRYRGSFLGVYRST